MTCAIAYQNVGGEHAAADLHWGRDGALYVLDEDGLQRWDPSDQSATVVLTMTNTATGLVSDAEALYVFGQDGSVLRVRFGAQGGRVIAIGNGEAWADAAAAP